MKNGYRIYAERSEPYKEAEVSGHTINIYILGKNRYFAWEVNSENI